jgi:hypothetical protein
VPIAGIPFGYTFSDGKLDFELELLLSEIYLVSDFLEKPLLVF